MPAKILPRCIAALGTLCVGQGILGPLQQPPELLSECHASGCLLSCWVLAELSGPVNGCCRIDCEAVASMLSSSSGQLVQPAFGWHCLSSLHVLH